MRNKIIVLVLTLCLIVVIAAVYILNRKNNSFEDYTDNGGSSMEFLPMEENPNVKQDVSDFDVTDNQDVNAYAASIHNAEVTSIYEVLVTDTAVYYMVYYSDGYCVNVIYSNGEYSFEDIPEDLGLEESD